MNYGLDLPMYSNCREATGTQWKDITEGKGPITQTGVPAAVFEEDGRGPFDPELLGGLGKEELLARFTYTRAAEPHRPGTGGGYC